VAAPYQEHGQTIIGEALIQFFGQAGALRVKGAPLDIANQIAGKV